MAHQQPAGNEFGEQLRRHRERAGLTQTALAKRAGADQSYINRLERGEREPPRRPLVVQLADQLALSQAERQHLLLLAGHLPDWLLYLPADDPTLSRLAEVLASPNLGSAAKTDLRQLIDLLLRHWAAEAIPPHPPTD
jgi:transcriptional regulator with XRE-family HTH domain